MEKVLRELSDTELDAVSGGASASAANVNTSTDTQFAAAAAGVSLSASAFHTTFTPPVLFTDNAFSVTITGLGAAAGSA